MSGWCSCVVCCVLRYVNNTTEGSKQASKHDDANKQTNKQINKPTSHVTAAEHIKHTTADNHKSQVLPSHQPQARSSL